MQDDANKLEAKKDYLSGMKYKDIAEKYEVSINTVKSWKQRNNWQRGPTQKKVHTKNKKGAHKIVETLSTNDGLNDQQKMFCLYYLQRFNATWAYMQAYDADYDTARVNGSRLLTKANVRNQIAELKTSIANDLFITADDIAKEYAKQAFADIGDYVDFETKPEQVMAMYGPMVDKNKNPVMQDKSRVLLRNKADVDTSLIKSIKVGKDGAVVELYDKQKALDSLLKYFEQRDKNAQNNEQTIVNIQMPQIGGDSDADS